MKLKNGFVIFNDIDDLLKQDILDNDADDLNDFNELQAAIDATNVTGVTEDGYEVVNSAFGLFASKDKELSVDTKTQVTCNDVEVTPDVAINFTEEYIIDVKLTDENFVDEDADVGNLAGCCRIS